MAMPMLHCQLCNLLICCLFVCHFLFLLFFCGRLKFLSHAKEFLRYLSPLHRAVLLAGANRQGLVTDAVLPLLVDAGDGWRTLDVSTSCEVTCDGLAAALAHAPHLLHLNVALCRSVDAEGCFNALANFCPDVEAIACTGIDVRGDAQVHAVMKAMPRYAGQTISLSLSRDQCRCRCRCRCRCPVLKTC